MDEIDLLKKYKKILRFLLLIVLIILFILYKMFESKIQMYELKKIFKQVFLIAGIVGIVIYILVYRMIVTKYKYSGNLEGIHIKDINREIPSTYSPAICSVLINKKIEAYKDYTATILYLESKKYLKLNFSTDGYKIIVLNNNIENLNEHEKYVFNCANNKEKFDIEEFKKNITEDMLKKELITNLKSNSTLIISMLLIISYIIGYISNSTLLRLACIIILGCTIIYNSIIANTVQTKINNIITKKGKKLTEEIIKFKNFIKEYTLLSERDIQYKELAEVYLAYAISLGEAHVIDEFLQKNKQYRSFIYYKQ